MRSFFVILLLGLLTGISSAQDWVQLNGPGGGYIYDVAVNSKGHIFVSSDSFQRSTDNGKTWMNLIFPYQSIIKIITLPSDVIIAVDYPASRVYRSTDNGDSWNYILESIKIWSGKNGYLFILSNNNSLQYSSDAGGTWVSKSLQGISKITDITSDTSGIFYVCSDYIYRSTDKGDSWEKKANGLPIDPYKILNIWASPSGELFATTVKGYGDSTIYRSKNNGDTWLQDLQAFSFVNSMSFSGNSVIISGSPSYISTDSGNTFQNLSEKIDTSFDLISHGIASPSGEFLFCDKYGLLKRFRPKSLAIEDIVLSNGIVTAMIEDHGRIIAFTTSTSSKKFVWKSSPDRTQWQVLPKTFSNPVHLAVRDSSGNILAVSMNEIVPLEGQYPNFLSPQVINSLVVSPNGSLFASNDNRIYRFTDSGDFWSETNINQQMKPIGSLGINRNGTLFAGTSLFEYSSNDNGDSWKVLQNVESIKNFTNTFSGDIIGFSEKGNALMLSTDNGKTWDEEAGNPVNGYIYNVLSLQSRSILAAANGGIYRHDSGIALWYPINKGLSQEGILCMISDSEGYVYAGSNGSGIFRSKEKIYSQPVTTKPWINVTAEIDFGTIAVGTSVSKKIELSNIGTASIALGKDFFVKDKIPFSIDTNSAIFPVTLEPKQSIIISISFHPPQVANYISEIDWASNVDPVLKEYMHHITKLHGVAVAKSDVKDISHDDISISIHPNPATGNSVIVNMTEVKEESTLSMFDVLGRELYKVKVLQGMTKMKIPITNIPEGIYYIRLSSQDRTITEKFVKK